MKLTRILISLFALLMLVTTYAQTSVARNQVTAGSEVRMTAEQRRKLNTFFSNFSEAGLEPFGAGQIRDDTLIQFGVLHNVINNPKLFEVTVGGDSQRIAARHVEAAVDKYFGVKVGQHKSLSGNYSHIKYRNGFYTMPRGAGEAYTFSQVAKLVDVDGSSYVAHVNVYVASSGSTLNPHGTMEEWKRTGVDVQLSARMKADIKGVSSGGKSRYILLSYDKR